MQTFWSALIFSLNIYVIAAFITLIVLGLVNIITKSIGKKNSKRRS